MKKLTNPLVWLRRIRHRCGYGIHSPFAFRFVTDVLYEPLPFYRFGELDRQLPLSQRFRIRRTLHMLFRISNHWQPAHMVVRAEPGSHVCQYLQAACLRAVVTHDFPEGEIGLCYLSQPCPEAVSHLGKGSILILDNLQQHLQWFHSLPSVVSFDLWDTGIAFFDPKYNKQHYLINF